MISTWYISHILPFCIWFFIWCSMFLFLEQVSLRWVWALFDSCLHWVPIHHDGGTSLSLEGWLFGFNLAGDTTCRNSDQCSDDRYWISFTTSWILCILESHSRLPFIRCWITQEPGSLLPFLSASISVSGGWVHFLWRHSDSVHSWEGVQPSLLFLDCDYTGVLTTIVLFSSVLHFWLFCSILFVQCIGCISHACRWTHWATTTFTTRQCLYTAFIPFIPFIRDMEGLHSWVIHSCILGGCYNFSRRPGMVPGTSLIHHTWVDRCWYPAVPVGRLFSFVSHLVCFRYKVHWSIISWRFRYIDWCSHTGWEGAWIIFAGCILPGDSQVPQARRWGGLFISHRARPATCWEGL